MVVANAVAAISEIREASEEAHLLLAFSQGTINKLLTALNECTESVPSAVFKSLPISSAVCLWGEEG